jgi:L-ascorbate metabolism protein UlaG (beta-lactamase superfamily)
MQLTKHVHACVTLDKGQGHLLLDPGAFTPNAAELVAATSTVLITHEHFDHFDEELIAGAVEDRPDLRIYGPDSVVGRWDGRPGQLTAVAEGDRLELEGFEVTVHGELHALIHRDIPQVHNVGYLIDGRVYHPGDSYHAPPASITTLLLPTSGPWTNVGTAVDYVRQVRPEQVVQIHEVMLSEIGQQSIARFLGPDMLGQVPVAIVPPGERVEV